jgi:8-oxo-dGTP pyrophosphatase MutT (NUDIX family)
VQKRYVIAHVYKHRLDDEVLLVMKDRPAWQKGFLNLVGGKIEEAETPEQAVLRELKEESGYEPSNKSYIEEVGLIEGDDELINCFCIPVSGFVSDPKPRAGETEVVRWYPWDLVKGDKRLIPSLRIIMPLIMCGVNNWKLGVRDSLMNKENATVELTLPSHLHADYKEKMAVNKILEKGRLDSPWEILL